MEATAAFVVGIVEDAERLPDELFVELLEYLGAV